MQRRSEWPERDRRIHDRGPWASRGPADPIDGRSVGWRRRAVASDAVRGLFELAIGPRPAGALG